MVTEAEEMLPINLQGGWPSPHLHPHELLKDAADSILASEKSSTSALIYGPELGYDPLRDAVAGWLTNVYKSSSGRITSERIGISNGASWNLAAILQKFTDPSFTQRVWMIEPTYFLACPIFHDAGFKDRLRGVPEDGEGINLEILKAGLVASEIEDIQVPVSKTSKAGYPKLYKHIIYGVPTFSNPSGKIMSIARRKGLVKLARDHDALIITDDVYDFLWWPAEEGDDRGTTVSLPPRLVDVDRYLEGTTEFGNAISNGSFAKIIAPGIKVGWYEAMPKFISAMGTGGPNSSGGCPSHFASTLVEYIVSNGSLAKHIENVLIPTYRMRYQKMMKAIREKLYPLGIRADTGVPFDGSLNNSSAQLVGGFFLYLHFPTNLPPVSEIAKIAMERYSLRIAPGEMFTVLGDAESTVRAKESFGEGARLCWAWHDESILIEGIERLARLIQEL